MSHVKSLGFEDQLRNGLMKSMFCSFPFSFMVPTTPPPTAEDSKWDLYNQSPFHAEDDFTNVSVLWSIKRI